jgi:signal transduction histidine kinase/ligand-binding sensor domain-containing protein/DNA-binding response OmpR family regulator
MSRIRHTYLILLWFVPATVRLSYGQPSDIRFHNLGLKDGLSHSLVNDMVEDDLGFLWFSTQEGLNRYDGYEFKVFYAGEGPKNPSKTWISGLHKDNHGQIWIYYQGGGIDRFDPVTETFFKYIPDSTKEGSISSDSHVATDVLLYNVFFDDSKGNFWIGTDKGLNLYDRVNESFVTYRSDPENMNSLSDNRITFITEDDFQNLWIGTQKGLNKFNPQTGMFTRFLPGNDGTKYLNDTVITYIHFEPDHSAWIGTLHGGLNIIQNPDREDNLYVLHPITESLNKNYAPTIHIIQRLKGGQVLVGAVSGLYVFRDKTSDPYFVPETQNTQVYSILEDNSGYVWVGSYLGPGLYRLHPDLKTTDIFRYDDKDKYSFRGNKVLFIKKSRNDIIWISVEKNGLFKVDMGAKKFRVIDDNPNRDIYLSNRDVYALYEDRQHNLWVGTKTELNRINLNTRQIRRFHNKLDIHSGMDYEYSKQLPAELIGVIKDYDGQKLWMGAFDYKISLFNPVTDEFLNFHNNENNPGSFVPWSLRSICITKSKQVYFGATGIGLCMLREDGKSFRYFPVVKTGGQGTNDSWINIIYEDKDSILWIGTLSGGLNRFDPRRQEFAHYEHDPDNPASLSNNVVKCILESDIRDDNTLWIGTHGGLNKFNKGTGEFIHYSVKEGLPSNTIHGILEDNKGNLWLSTNKGLVLFDPASGRIRVYTEDDGLQSNEFNEGSYFKNKDGIMYFGGTHGITYFDPAEIEDNPFEVRVVLTNFKLYNRPVHAGDMVKKRIILKKAISYTREIFLLYSDKIISFEFAGLHYVAPDKIKYRYILEGFERDWNEVDASQRFANYTNIPSGDYTLKVIASNNDGIWSDHPATLKIHIVPPFWEKFWFKAIIIGFVLILFMAIVQIRTRLLKRQKVLLQNQVENRTHELKKANELLESKQREIMTQSEKIAQQRDFLKEKNVILENQKGEIQKMAEKLHETDQMKLSFFTNISHEFRTPLTLIMGPTENLLAQNNYNDTPVIKENLSLIHRNIKRLYKLINQLLEIRRVETGNLKLQTQKEDIVKYLFEIFQLFRPFAEKKDIDFQFISDKEVNELFIDTDKIEKIFYNLLSNAFKHTPVGGKISLSITDNQQLGDREMIRIDITDSGPGIEEKHQPHIFDRFYQISNKTSSGRISTGIGLSLSKDLVEAHYGEIRFTTQLNRGTTFSVFLPKSDEHLKPEEISNESEIDYSFEYMKSMLESPAYSENDKISGIAAADDKPRILVIEDNADMQQFLYNELKGDYKVVLAKDGIEGLEIAKDHLPDLILSDVMMPGMDGISLCEKIKTDELTSHVPVLLLTAKSDVEHQISGLETGADDYIIKPFNPEVLKLRLKNTLDVRKQMAEKFSKDFSIIPANIKITQIDQGFLEKFVKTVEENIDDTELSGDRLAFELNMSKGNLYKKLKALTGMTVNIYLRTIRLKIAARLLKNGNYNISEVAYAVGFSNPKYFSTCFSELFLKSPKEYMHEQ